MAGGFRSTTVVGRGPERVLLDRLLANACDGRGSCVVLAGEAGIGKSRLASLAAELADVRNVRLLLGRASAAPGAAALRPVAEAVAAATRRSAVTQDARLAPYLPVLARFAPALGIVTSVEAPAVLVGEALIRLACQEGRPALLVLEDLHWADPDTLGVVEYVADHCRDEPLAVLLTTRPASGPGHDLLVALEQRKSVAVHRLPRLEAGGTDELAASCLGVDVAALPASMRELIAPSDGLPLLVEDLLADAAGRGVLREDAGVWVVAGDPAGSVPPGYAASVERRLVALDDDTRCVLNAAAVLGREFDPVWLTTMTGLTSAQVDEALARATTAQLLDDGLAQFRHALTREAVLGTVPVGERSRLAGLAADVGKDRAALGLLAELCATAGRPDEAARLFLSAAALERGTGTLDAASRLTNRAQELAQDPTLAQEAALARVEVLGDSGRYEEAQTVATEVLPYLDQVTANTVHRRLAGAALRAQKPETAARHLDAAGSGAADPDAVAEVWALRAEVALESATASRLDEAEDLAYRAVDAARRAGRPAATCAALLVLGRCLRRRDLGAAEGAFQEARAVADAANLVPQRISALAELGTIQMLRDVKADALVAARASALQIGALVTATGIAVNVAGVRLMTGEVEQAASTAREARAHAQRFGMRGAAAMLAVFQGAALGFTGDVIGMEALLAEAEHDADPDVLVGSHAIARATVALLAEDRAKALRELHRADEVIRRNPVLMIDPSAGPSALLAALASTADAAALDIAEQRSGTGSAWTATWVDSARAVIARDAGPTFERGLAAARRYPVFGLVAQRLVAEAQVRDGWGEPVPWLATLEQQALARGYDRVASACRSLRRQAGDRVPRARAVDLDLDAPLRSLGITAREAEVLALLAERPTNPEIARRLFVSPRTVEKHVASLLQKTGAADRAELAAIAAAPATAPALRR